MAVTISIPPTLQRFSAGRAEISLEATRLDQALAGLALLHPELGRQAFTPDGRARPFVRVFLNSRDCTRGGDPTQPLAMGDKITLISAFAGG